MEKTILSILIVVLLFGYVSLKTSYNKLQVNFETYKSQEEQQDLRIKSLETKVDILISNIEQNILPSTPL